MDAVLETCHDWQIGSLASFAVGRARFRFGSDLLTRADHNSKFGETLVKGILRRLILDPPCTLTVCEIDSS